MADQVNVGGIVADLELNSGNLEAGLKKARQALDLVEAEIKQLQQDFSQGAIAAADFNTRMAALNATTATLIPKMQAAYSATKNLGSGLDVAGQRASASGRQMQIGMQQASYGVGDFLSVSGGLGPRINSVANNVQYATMSMGPWGMAVGVAVTALGAAVTMFERSGMELNLFGKTVDYSKTEVERLTEAIETLSKKSVKLAVDHLELDNLEKQLKRIKDGNAAFDKAEGKRSKAEEDEGKRTAEALAEATPGGERAVVNQLRAEMEDDKKASDGPYREAKAREADLTKRLADMEAKGAQIGEIGGVHEIAKESMKQGIEKAKQDALTATRKIQDDAKQEAGNLLADATAGDAFSRADLAKRLRKHGRGDVADQIEGKEMTPSELKKWKEGEKADLKHVADRDEKEGEKADRERQRKQKWAMEHGVFGGSILSGIGQMGGITGGLLEGKALQEKAEEDEARRKKREAAEHKAEAERKKAHDATMKKAEDRLPGMENIAEGGITGLLAKGFTPERARMIMQTEVERLLKARGLTGAEADEAAGSITGKAKHDVRADIVRRALAGSEEIIHSVTTGGGTDLRASAQSAITNKLGTMPEKLDDIKNLLAEGLRRPGVTWI